jgi:hypothetical protein
LAKSTTVHATFEAQTEEMEGFWRATLDPLGLFAYGDTAGEASDKLTEALHILVDTLYKHGGIAAVQARFEAAGFHLALLEQSGETRHKLPLMLTLAKTLPTAP